MYLRHMTIKQDMTIDAVKSRNRRDNFVQREFLLLTPLTASVF
jgi:hypothetical protein